MRRSCLQTTTPEIFFFEYSSQSFAWQGFHYPLRKDPLSGMSLAHIGKQPHMIEKFIQDFKKSAVAKRIIMISLSIIVVLISQGKTGKKITKK